MTEQKAEVLLSLAGKRPGLDLLESWKEIAVFFKRDVRTVQLWEQHERMPVHRHVHRKLATVHGYRSELSTWWNERCRRQNVGAAADGQAVPPHEVSLGTAGPRSMACVLKCISPDVSPNNGPLAGFRQEIESRIQLLTQWQVTPSHNGYDRNHAPGAGPQNDWQGIHYLLSGTILDSANGCQVNLQLTSLKCHSAVWSRQFTGTVSTVPEQQSLAQQIAVSVARHVLVLPPSNVSMDKTLPGARYAYLRGRYFWSMRSQPEALRRALEQFKLATELDPGHARSYAGLADCYIVMCWLAMLPRRVAVSNAKRAATQALLLDSTLSEAHVSLASILFDFQWNWEGAEREFLHAIRLNPSNAQAYQWYGESLSILGADENAIHAAQRAQEVDPASAVVASFVGKALYRSGQTQAAMAQFRDALKIDADYMVAHAGLGLANVQEERFDEAIHCFGVACRLSGDYPEARAMMAHAYALKGDKSTGRTLLAQLTAGGPSYDTPVLDIAATYVALNDTDAAFDCLHAGMKRRNMRLTMLRRDPRLRPLHSDSRFSRLLDTLRMP